MATHETQSRMEPRRRRAERRRRPPLLVIVLAGLAAVTVAFLVARAIDEERPHGPYLIGAWTFGDRSSLQRAVDAEAIDEVSVDWLQSRADGGLEAPKYDAGFISLARKQDCRVFVTLTDYDETSHQFDSAISAAILANAKSRRRHATAVAVWCREHHVDGVDVDWEAVRADQRGSFSKFVEDLAKALHRDGRMIAVDVYPKTREPGGWETGRERRTGGVWAGPSISSV